jgi:tetratricopeptide (TPR) repeat protein
MNKSQKAAFLVALPILLLGCAGARAAGWGFVPEPAEYAAWPEHCRVQYSYINRGANAYGDAYPQAAISVWRMSIGEKTFTGAHHYCAALIYLNRLRLENDPKMRQFLIGRALDDGYFTYSRAEKQSNLFPNIAVVMAQAKFENKEADEAFKILNDAIAAQPKRIESYAALANMHRKQKNLAQARDVLQQADVNSEGTSAEVKYNLGLLQIELGDIDAAVESAKQAYALGHPLPGLRNKLQKLGRSLSDNKVSMSQDGVQPSRQ